MDHLSDVPVEFLEEALEDARASRKVVRRRLSELEVGHLDEAMAEREERSETLMNTVKDELLLLDAVVETLEVRLGQREEVSVELPRLLQEGLQRELEEIADRARRWPAL